MQPDTTGIPLYQAIANTLKTAIRQGQYPVGKSLPTEKQLCKQFSASRHTVREALRQLTELGMITRKQGSGTQVQSSEPRLSFIQHVSTIDELLHYGAETRFEILNSESLNANEKLAKLLNCHVDDPCLRFYGIRYSTQHTDPVCVTEAFMPVTDSNASERMSDLQHAVFEIRRDLDLSNLGRVEQNISAVNINEKDADVLKVPVGAVALQTTRRYIDTEDGLFLACISVHPADRFSYDVTLTHERS
jgi:DNA-binding GntR family transcriptional regulator